MTFRRLKTVDGDTPLFRGKWQNDPSEQSAVLDRLRTRRGSIKVLPNFGTRTWEIRVLDSSAPRRAEVYTVQALSDLVTARRIRGLLVTVTRRDTALDILVEYRDRRGRQQTVRYTHRTRI